MPGSRSPEESSRTMQDFLEPEPTKTTRNEEDAEAPQRMDVEESKSEIGSTNETLETDEVSSQYPYVPSTRNHVSCQARNHGMDPCSNCSCACLRLPFFRWSHSIACEEFCLVG